MNATPITPADTLLRLPEVKRLVPLSTARIYRLIAQGIFPSPVSIGPAAVAWRQADVLAFLQERAAERQAHQGQRAADASKAT